jgi:hypothetical protein
VAGGGVDVTLLLGSQLAVAVGAAAAVPGVARVRVADAGRPFVGVWWHLAEELGQNHAGARRVLVADYDPLLRYLCLTAVDVPATTTATATATATAAATATANAAATAAEADARAAATALTTAGVVSR